MITNKSQIGIDFVDANDWQFDDVIEDIDERIDHILGFNELNTDSNLLKKMIIQNLMNRIKHI